MREYTMMNVLDLKPTDRIVIYTPRASFPGGRAYLCADGSTSSNRADAAEHWGCQFDAVVAENWIVQPASFEFVARDCGSGLTVREELALSANP